MVCRVHKVEVFHSSGAWGHSCLVLGQGLNRMGQRSVHHSLSEEVLVGILEGVLDDILEEDLDGIPEEDLDGILEEDHVGLELDQGVHL